MASNKLVVVLSAFSIFVSFLFFLDGPADAKLDDVLVLVLEVGGVVVPEVGAVGAVVVRPVSLGVEAAVVMSDTSYGIHSGLVCGSSSLQAGDSTRGLGESGVKARVSLLSPGSVVGVSLLLAGGTEPSRSVGGLTTALLFITACSSKTT